jgi:hypothetical protein
VTFLTASDRSSELARRPSQRSALKPYSPRREEAVTEHHAEETPAVDHSSLPPCRPVKALRPCPVRPFGAMTGRRSAGSIALITAGLTTDRVARSPCPASSRLRPARPTRPRSTKCCRALVEPGRCSFSSILISAGRVISTTRLVSEQPQRRLLGTALERNHCEKAAYFRTTRVQRLHEIGRAPESGNECSVKTRRFS